MKKIFLSVTSVMLAVMTNAVTYMQIKTTDNQKINHKVSNINKVDYNRESPTSSWFMQTTTEDGKAYSYDVNKVVEVTFVSISIDSIEAAIQGVSVSGVIGNYSYVDLGLESGLKWATYNVGATLPTEPGNYYAWGETATKTDYSLSTVAFYNDSIKEFTKYTNADSLSVLESADDAAAVNWSDSWRTPTVEEQKEMLAGCDWTWTDDFNNSGVKGYIGTSKANANIIFLPATGVYDGKDKIYPNRGLYMSASVDSSNKQKNHYINFNFSGKEIGELSQMRFYGIPVRAVNDLKNYSVKFFGSDSLLINEQNVYEGQSAIVPTAPELDGYDFIGWSDSSFVKVEKDLIIYAQYEKNDIAIIENGVSVNGKVDNYSYVNLGLESGLKWATYNVGATLPTEPGNYYAWGETATKTDYSFSTLAFYNDSIKEFTKYTNADSLSVLESADDAAAVNWSDSWRTPTVEEQNELLAGCDWTWTDDFNNSGVKGFIGTSKTNANIIFLPATGVYDGKDKIYPNRGLYMSASVDSSNKQKNHYINFNFSEKEIGELSQMRFYGIPVRAVTK